MTIVRPDVALSYVSMHRTLCTSELPAPGAVPRFANLLRSLFHDRPAGVWPAESVHLSSVAERVAEFPLTNPRLPASAWELTALGEEEHLGRTVRRVRAMRRPGSVPYPDDERPSGYWPWLDEYECLVDDALNVLLRLTGMADGVPVGIISADEVRVDAAFPEAVFAFVPPAGTHTVHVGRRS